MRGRPTINEAVVCLLAGFAWAYIMVSVAIGARP
jgi:hypothetical protein